LTLDIKEVFTDQLNDTLKVNDLVAWFKGQSEEDIL
jgi:hypothetical protein